MTFSRAVALGLTAEDMVAVQEFTEGLKTSKQQPESVATIIRIILYFNWLPIETFSRAVALGLTAEDMIAVQEFTEGLKTRVCGHHYQNYFVF